MMYGFLPLPRGHRFCVLCLRQLPDLNLFQRILHLDPPPLCTTDKPTCQRRYNERIGVVL